jgi:hypothetical protein
MRPRSAESVPHFEVTDVDGRQIRYADDVWQHHNLVFVALDPDRPEQSERYARDLRTRSGDFAAADTAVVISRTPIHGLPSPGVIVADRWGEVVYTFQPDDRHPAMPDSDQLLDWVTFVREQCPECPPD